MVPKVKFKIGDKVEVVNRWAMFTNADVKIGDIGKVLTESTHPEIVMDKDIGTRFETFPWSIPQRGLELVE